MFDARIRDTIKVVQIGRARAGAIRLDDDRAESVALAQDLGHTPFGHTGEEALDACMADYGGFEHNSHGLRLVTELERRYAALDGLNPTQPTPAGVLQHHRALLYHSRPPAARIRGAGGPASI